jgi:hypothetical protein
MAGCPEDELDDKQDDAASTTALSVCKSERSIHRTEAVRKALLEMDPRAEEVKPTEVLCKKCQKWIKLSKRCSFAAYNWHAHQRRCSRAVYAFFLIFLSTIYQRAF